MKKLLPFFLALACCFATAFAQPGPRGGMMGGGSPQGPNLGGAMAKLFGENTSFSANLEFQLKPASGEPMNMPGKIAFDQGKSRFEIDMTKAMGSRMNADNAAMMKSMGMDSMVMLSLPEKKVTLLVYPGLNAYVENPMKDNEGTNKLDQYKVEVTEISKETLDGHACIKNKVVVTDDKGATHESTVWNSSDLKMFPVRIESVEKGSSTAMLFKDIKLAKVDASQFDPPAGATKYNDMMTMMMEEMMKRRGRGP
jgi:hypothetical protein